MPSIELSEDGKSYIIRGAIPAPEIRDQIAHRIGPDEEAVQIDQAIIYDFLREQRSLRGRLHLMRIRLRNWWVGRCLRKKFKKMKKGA